MENKLIPVLMEQVNATIKSYDVAIKKKESERDLLEHTENIISAQKKLIIALQNELRLHKTQEDNVCKVCGSKLRQVNQHGDIYVSMNFEYECEDCGIKLKRELFADGKVKETTTSYF